MFGWLKRIVSRRRPSPAVQQALQVIRGRYDAAITTDENRRHWSGADNHSANAANNPHVRRILRMRSRYEVGNNSYAKGIVLTLANDCIGTGPRLQMLTDSPETNRRIERAFHDWSHAVRLAEKLRTLRMARATDGEGFAVLSANPELDSPIEVDLHPVEADQVTTPDLAFGDQRHVDGITFDQYGNPSEYHVLKHHPGDTQVALHDRYHRVPAAAMLHYYRVDRPGQARGVPDITPALPLFAHLRRYTLAVILAAEMAAVPGGVLYTDAPAQGEADPVEPMDVIELERGMLMTMPGGWKMGQIRAEQPTTTYAEFKHEVLNEIARCLNLPFNIASGNSSGYNYASGRLDHQTYHKSLRVEQAHLETAVLKPLLAVWFEEAIHSPGLLPARMDRSELRRFQFFWDGMDHVDPSKEANAQSLKLANHATTLADEYARRGQDWETQLRQRAKEHALLKELGLPTSDALPTKGNDDDEAIGEEEIEETTPTAA